MKIIISEVAFRRPGGMPMESFRASRASRVLSVALIVSAGLGMVPCVTIAEEDVPTTLEQTSKQSVPLILTDDEVGQVSPNQEASATVKALDSIETMGPGTKENQAIIESGGASEPLPGDAAAGSGSSTETAEIPAGATDGGNPTDKETDSSLNEETSSEAEEKPNSGSANSAVNLPALRDVEEENSKADKSNKVENPQETKQSESEVSKTSNSGGPAAARVAAANSANTAIPKGWERVFGQDEFDTMQAISKKGWADDSCSTVAVATISGYWDALSAGPLAPHPQRASSRLPEPIRMH